MVALVKAQARGGFLWSSCAGPTCADRIEKVHSIRIILGFIILLKNWARVDASPLFFLLSNYMHHPQYHKLGIDPDQIER